MTYLLTFSCYGQRLHGDERGSIDRRCNIPGARSIQANPYWQRTETKILKYPPFHLSSAHRELVLQTIHEACTIRAWQLHVAHVRSTHVHVLISGEERPEELMRTLKASATRRLREDDQHDRRRWARFGSTIYLWTDKAISAAKHYVLDCQGERMSHWP